MLTLPVLLTLILSGPGFAVSGDLYADREEGNLAFDGGAAGVAAVEKRTPAAADKNRLLSELKVRIVFEGDKHGEAAFNGLLSEALDSPSARESAGEFLKSNARVRVSFAKLSGSLVRSEGKEFVAGQHAYTYMDETPPRVALNELLAGHDRGAAITTLTHEMFGHSVEAVRLSAREKEFNDLALDEEENARLIGWLSAAELGYEPGDDAWAYLQDPEEEMRSIRRNGYAARLTREEMRDPLPAYRERLAELDREAEKAEQKLAKCAKWASFIDHLVAVHKMEESSFEYLRGEISSVRRMLPDYRAGILKDRADLKARLERLSGGGSGLGKLRDRISGYNGGEFINELSMRADDEYFKRREEKIRERRARLMALLAGKKQASPPPPPAGQISFEELKLLLTADAVSCPAGK